VSKEAFLEVTISFAVNSGDTTSGPMLVRFGAIQTITPLASGTKISLGGGTALYATESYEQIAAALAGVKPL
jgi:hypothetical protein